MQPYQQATQQMIKQGEMPLRSAGKVASIASSAYAGGKLLGQVLPLLNQYIPQDLAIKGLSKINPSFGKFINTALENGKPFDEIKEYIKEKAETAEESAKENRNVIQQYSPELHQFIDDQVKNGRSPIEAGAIAQHDKRFSDVIKKLIKDHKTPWSNILESVYGSQQMAQPEQQSQGQQNQPMSIKQMLTGNANPTPEQVQQIQQQGQTQQPQQQGNGQGQQALMAILQKINQRMGG